MKAAGRRIVMMGLVLAMGLLASPSAAAPANQFVLRTPATSLDGVLNRNGLQFVRSVDGPAHSIFLVQGPVGTPPDLLEAQVGKDAEVQAFEPLSDVVIPEALAGANLNQSTVAILDTIANRTLVPFFGNTAWFAYVNQPASTITNLSLVRSLATGVGVVAIIDTGVDPRHPVLKSSLVAGYDFVNNIPGVASEWADLDQSTVAILDQSTVAILDGSNPVTLNQSTVAILDQSTVAILDTTRLPAAFGHGTMVAGIVHWVVPTAQIMPLKAFRADGTSNSFDILRAIYYAVDHGANVINMSFSLSGFSQELARAINYATDHGVICVSSAGNSGMELLTYPAALRNVIGVASTNNLDGRSVFSNYGPALVTLAAPGEGIITTYPGGHYAAAWGTSFSTPIVAGAPALLLQYLPTAGFFGTVDTFSHAKELSLDLGYGRLDLYKGLTSRLKSLGVKF